MTGARGFPFPDRPGVAMEPAYLAEFRRRPLYPVHLKDGRPALLVTRHEDVRTVLADPRFSREAWVHGTLFARESKLLALVTSDPPVHTARRQAAQAAFTRRQAELARPWIEQQAEELLDAVEAAGPPADLVAGYTTPLAYRTICRIVGIPVEDTGVIRHGTDRMMSAGRFGADEAAAASERMVAYFADRVRGKRELVDAGRPGDDLITTLITQPDPLSDEEITVLAMGLVMAGGETTTNHLAMCVQHAMSEPGLYARLREDPAAIPAAVEELLRWVWFAYTGGQPHVALADVELTGGPVAAGTVVVPLTDAANRDPAAFECPDEFRADRHPNPHLGFGHGRHLCLGAPHARVEAQVGLAALVRRFARLEPAGSTLDWRSQMFIRGVWKLPVRWAPR